MKRYLKIFLVFVISFVLVGCGNSDSEKKAEPNGKIAENKEETESTKTKVITCKLEKEDTANSYTLVTTYELTVEDEVVTKNKMKEVITSSSKDMLTYFETYLKSTYESMNTKYGGYEYSIVNDGKQVISNTTVDYTKVNVEKLIEDDASMKLMVNDDNKVTLSGVKSVYQTLGIECSE